VNDASDAVAWSGGNPPDREARIQLRHIAVHRLTLPDIVDLVAEAVEGGRKWVIANHNLHSFYLSHGSRRLREFFSAADWVQVDGMAIVALARLYGKSLARDHRVTYVDLLGPLMRRAARDGWRVFYLGSRPETGARALETLRGRHPGLKIASHTGYFNASKTSGENRRVVDTINEYGPNVLLVGMGMPRQETWIMENFQELRANAILTSGAAMEYVAGTASVPPRWSGRVGLEWAFRLIFEPRRLAYRYLVEPCCVIGLLLKDRFMNRQVE